MPEAHSWIVARLEHPFREKIALRFLELAHHNFYCPRTRVVSPKQFVYVALLFNPYFFVEVDDLHWGDIRRSTGIASLIMRNGAPAVVPPAVITALRQRENRHGLIDVVPAMRRGRRVAITSGAFSGYEGIIAADPNHRVRVLFDCILGSRREVSFPTSAVTAL